MPILDDLKESQALIADEINRSVAEYEAARAAKVAEYGELINELANLSSATNTAIDRLRSAIAVLSGAAIS